MSETTPPAGARGAVDLSSVAGLTAPTAATAGSGMPAGPVPGQPTASSPAVPAGLVVDVDANNLQEAPLVDHDQEDEVTDQDLALDVLVPDSANQPYDMRAVVEAIVDDGHFLEMQALYAPNVMIGYARVEGHTVGIVANQPLQFAGTLDIAASEKAARFVRHCDAFNVPLLFLSDVPGFMVGTAVERQGIIRHGAKMISAVSEATVPKICVIVRKAYGAGLYAMAGPGFEPDATLALPTAKIAVMGPEAAVNAVFANRIAAIEDPVEREAFVQAEREAYEADVDLLRLASELVVDAVVDFGELRGELIRRLARGATRDRHFSDRRHGVPPV